jgi:hypothetical protein
MALSPLFTVSIASDRSTFTITDSTTYGTGGNPARADLRVFLTCYKVDSENVSTAVTLTSDDSDAQTDSVWTGTMGVDGHYKFLYVAIPEYAGGTTYAENDAVFDAADDAVYVSAVAGNVGQSLSDTDFWTPESDPSSLAANDGEADESANITSFIYRRILTPNSQWRFATMVSEQSSNTDYDDFSTLQDIIEFDNLLTGAVIADTRTEVTDGEIICRKIQSKYIDGSN